MSKRVTIGRALGATAVLLGVLTVSQTSFADVPCSTRTTKAYFSPWGDTNQYFPAPGGTFEGSANTAFAGGAKVVADQEPWKVAGSTHAKAAQIPAGGSVKLEKFCVNSDEDSLRLFYKKPGVAGSALWIHVRVTSGVNVATNELTVDGSTAGWAVLNRMMLPDIRDASGRQWVEITLGTRNAAATWRVDDVMIDPWRTK